MVRGHPMRIPGRWQAGFALDFHTLSSTYLGEDQHGHPAFETQRTDLGELLYQFKYRNDEAALRDIVATAASFVRTWDPEPTAVVATPASRQRVRQPVAAISLGLARSVGLPFLADAVRCLRHIPELKNIYEYERRLSLLEDVHTVDGAVVQGQRVLLLDDLYRSGATMNAVAKALYDRGGAAAVFALTITRTRSRA